MTAPLLTITAYGLPAPQGSKRHVGGGVMVESSKKLKPWRTDVKDAAERFIESQRARGNEWQPIDAPLVVSMVFTFARPKGHYRTGRNAHLLRDAAPVRPATTPDLSKLIRSTEDALTDAGIWRDDCLVVRYTDTGKAYPAGDDLALTSPGVVIRIWAVDEIATPTPGTPEQVAEDIAAAIETWFSADNLTAIQAARIARHHATQYDRPVVAPYRPAIALTATDTHLPAGVA